MLRFVWVLGVLMVVTASPLFGAAGPTTGVEPPMEDSAPFPPPLDSYGDDETQGLWRVLVRRAHAFPFNVVATGLFLMAIIHTFLAAQFRRLAHVVEERHRAAWWSAVQEAEKRGVPPPRETISVRARLLHFFGEVEAVFGIWTLPLLALMAWQMGNGTMVRYLEESVHYQEPLFVVVIMALASTRPILELAQRCLRAVAVLGGATPTAWWFTILIIAPLLGSFITEPGAMTIAAMLLGRQFYSLNPSPRLAYGTLGLLFVNISVGGTLTHFAAPPVLMVAGKWGWDTPFMLEHFGWQAAAGIVAATVAMYLALRREFTDLADPWEKEALEKQQAEERAHPIPWWVTFVHVIAMGWAVINAHHPVLLIGGFLFFLAFYTATEDFQHRLDLRGPILVGFFLAGLVIHGGLQAWWIAPTLGGLSEWPLFFTGAVLTAFNDNAAITYLSTLVPGFTEGMKHAVVAGAVTGGGLTVIANAPNPAGQSILQRFFPGGVNPLGLLLGALIPTIVLALTFMLL